MNNITLIKYRTEMLLDLDRPSWLRTTETYEGINDQGEDVFTLQGYVIINDTLVSLKGGEWIGVFPSGNILLIQDEDASHFTGT